MEKRIRESNFELLRIVAMLMVYIHHANYWRIGVPTADMALSAPLSTFVRIFFQVIADPCVDVFVILSGYFAIRPKWKSILNLWFLMAFWAVVLAICCGGVSFRQLPAFIFPFFGWFLPCYLGLVLVAPILNAYAEQASKKAIGIWLLIFFVLQFSFDIVYAFFPGYPQWEIFGRTIFNGGRSVLSFAALYILGRFIKLHWHFWLELTARRYFVLYVAWYTSLSVGLFVVLYCAGLWSVGKVTALTLVTIAGKNSNLTTVIGSVILFMAFSRLHFSSRFVNWMAASVLGTFFFHAAPFYEKIVKLIFSEYNGFMVVLVDGGFILLVFSAGVVLDQVRRACFSMGERVVERLIRIQHG